MACLVSAALLLAAGCPPSGRSPAETITDYLQAVQQQDLDALYCLMAGAAEAEELGADPAERRAAFEAWALAHYERYLEGRDEGWVDLDEQGLVLVKLFALGQGTFFENVSSRSSGGDARVIVSDVRFAYAQVDLSGFSPGTTFYVCGAPVGEVHAIRVPPGPKEISVDVLSSVLVEWTLVRSSGNEGCPTGWAVASVAAVEGSVRETEVTWIF